MALSWVEAGWNPAGHPSRFVAIPDPIPLSDDLAALLCIVSGKKTIVEAVDSVKKTIVALFLSAILKYVRLPVVTFPATMVNSLLLHQLLQNQLRRCMLRLCLRLVVLVIALLWTTWFVTTLTWTTWICPWLPLRMLRQVGRFRRIAFCRRSSL